MKNLPTKAIIFVAAGLLLFVLVSIIVILVSSKPNTDPLPASPTPVIPSLSINSNPLTIKDAPTAAPANGSGTDVDSQIVKNSVAQIEKLYPSLPFETSFVSSRGVSVNILIPAKEFQTNPYTLRAQVFGINYNTSSGQPDYETMKQSFIEAANIVFNWIKNNNADPEKIIYVWGDKAVIQNRAELWLN